MIKLLVFLSVFISAILISSAPWVSALLYSTVSILQPHYIWNWAFDSFSIFTVSAAVAILAWGWQILQGNVNWEVYKTGQFKGMIGLLIIFHLSNALTPYDTYFSLVSGDLMVETFTTIAIMYTVILGLIKSEKTIKYFGFMYILVVLYFAYWANEHYFSGNWYMFRWGRLLGLQKSPYRDGNVMSIVLTTGLGFVMFGITFFKQKLIKYFLILSVPLVWHALILFASRGALLSAAAVTLFFVMVMRSKTLNLAVLAGFTAMLIWQGAMLTSRTTSTVAQAQQENVDVPLNPRLVSWGVGIDIALEHPLLGAGPQRFQYASAVLFPGKSPHVAHNTFLNFSANTGIIAGLIYLSFFIVSFKQYKYVRKYKQGDTVNGYINLACAGGLVGYFVGAIFLDLIVFEPFYFLLVLMSVNYCMVKAGSVSPSPG
jgi:O-antigen ligase